MWATDIWFHCLDVSVGFKIDLDVQPELRSSDLNILADSWTLYTFSLYDSVREIDTVKSELKSSGKQLFCDMCFLYLLHPSLDTGI